MLCFVITIIIVMTSPDAITAIASITIIWTFLAMNNAFYSYKQNANAEKEKYIENDGPQSENYVVDPNYENLVGDVNDSNLDTDTRRSALEADNIRFGGGDSVSVGDNRNIYTDEDILPEYRELVDEQPNNRQLYNENQRENFIDPRGASQVEPQLKLMMR